MVVVEICACKADTYHSYVDRADNGSLVVCAYNDAYKGDGVSICANNVDSRTEGNEICDKDSDLGV